MGLLELDFKKVIALSTLSQVALMMSSLCVGLKLVRFYHLLTHAYFKSLLFLLVGVLIHGMFTSQEFRGYSIRFNTGVMTGLLVPITGLCGLLFTRGYYSKDLILELYYTGSCRFTLVLVLYGSMFLTFMYSFRLLVTLGYFNIPIRYIGEVLSSIYCLFGLLVLTLSAGLVLWWNRMAYFIDSRSLVKWSLTLMALCLVIYLFRGAYVMRIGQMFLLNLVTRMTGYIFSRMKQLVFMLEKSFLESLAFTKVNV